MNGIIVGILLPIGVAALFAGLTAFLSRAGTHNFGMKIGKFLSPLFGNKVGKKAYEKFEGSLQTTIYDFCMGLIKGLDEDDDNNWKAPVNNKK